MMTLLISTTLNLHQNNNNSNKINQIKKTKTVETNKILLNKFQTLKKKMNKLIKVDLILVILKLMKNQILMFLDKIKIKKNRQKCKLLMIL
jgi:hypothetical protein